MGIYWLLNQIFDLNRPLFTLMGTNFVGGTKVVRYGLMGDGSISIHGSMSVHPGLKLRCDSLEQDLTGVDRCLNQISATTILISMFCVRKNWTDSSKRLGYTSWCHWGCKWIWVMQHNTHITFITVKTGSPTKDPHSSDQTHRNAEKRGNILIRSCFLSGSWEGSIISCYALHLFSSLRTRDVSELVSLFPLRHVPLCHEKSMCDCCPGEKKNPRLSWRYDGARRLHYKVKGTCAKFQVS